MSANNPSNSPSYAIARWFLIAFGLLVLAVFLWNIRNILMLGLAAIIVVVFVTIPVSYLTRIRVFGMRLPRSLAIILTFVGLFLIFVALALLVLPTLIDQFIVLGEVLVDGLERAVAAWNEGEIQAALPFLEELAITEDFSFNAQQVQDIAEQGLSALGQVGGSVIPVIGGIANTLLSLLIVTFLSIFLLAEPETYRNGLVSLSPLWYRHRVNFILDRLYLLLRRWIFAAAIGMTITGIGTFFGLSMVGIEQAAALAVLTAFFSFVPSFGELLAVLVALAVGVVQAPDRLVWIVVVIYGVSFIQGQIFAPLITAESVEIPPVLILLGQVVVAGFFGAIGIILAVPILVICMVLIQEVYIKDILGDRSLNTAAEKARPLELSETVGASGEAEHVATGERPSDAPAGHLADTPVQQPKISPKPGLTSG